jgi:protein tyrosine/serine phosphatase
VSVDPTCHDQHVSIQNGYIRWLPLDGAANARVVVPGALLRSDNLQSLTPADIRLLVEKEALEVVLDLRTELEVELEGPGPITREPRVRIEQHSLFPRSGGRTDLDASSVKLWPRNSPSGWPDEPRVVQAYLSYITARPDSVVASIRTIANARGAVLVHCAAGKDRTGMVVALALDAAGVDRKAIVSDYVATSQRIDAIFARLASSATYRSELKGHDPQAHVPVPGTMERVFELLHEGFGSSVGWLSAHGLGDADLERLRGRMAPVKGSASS